MALTVGRSRPHAGLVVAPRIAPLAAPAVGVALPIWLGVQITVIGFSMDPPLQPMDLVLGALITVVGLAWVAESRPLVIGRGLRPR